MSGAPVESNAVDGRSLTPEAFSATVESITASFGDRTRRDIYLRVRESAEGLTAAEIAKAVDLHNNVARHHLDKLAAAGHVVVDIRRAAGVGRPSKRYRAARSDITLEFPVRHDDLLGTLLGRALALLPKHEAEHLAGEVGHEYGLHLAAAMAPGEARRSLHSALHLMASRPAAKTSVESCGSCLNTARSVRPPSTIRSFVRSTEGSSEECWQRCTEKRLRIWRVQLPWVIPCAQRLCKLIS